MPRRPSAHRARIDPSERQAVTRRRALHSAAAARSTAAAASSQGMAAVGAAAGAAAPQVAVVTTLSCPYCKKTKAALQVGVRETGWWASVT